MTRCLARDEPCNRHAVRALAATVALTRPCGPLAVRAGAAMVNLDAGVNALAAQTQARAAAHAPLRVRGQLT